jgi:hypothetical protein
MLKISVKEIIIHHTDHSRLLFDTAFCRLHVATWRHAGLSEMDGMIGFPVVSSRPIESSLRKVNNFVGRIFCLLFLRNQTFNRANWLLRLGKAQ